MSVDDDVICRSCGQVVTPGWTVVCDHCRMPLPQASDGPTSAFEGPATQVGTIGPRGLARRRSIARLLALAGLAWLAVAFLLLTSGAPLVAPAVAAIPAGLFLLAASGWWDGTWWADLVAALAVVATIAIVALVVYAVMAFAAWLDAIG
jgi:hypothetical protein